MRLQSWLHGIAAIAAMSVLGACTHALVPAAPAPPAVATTEAALPAARATAVPPAALRVEGVPPLPADLLQEIQRFDQVAGHGFVDWHPILREMIVAHRAPGASTTQI